ncbi:rhomboid-like protein [Streptomyces sp. NPDC020917]|uniref:rhomboid-like protein n=1 Tax=Streptomyces sp. NPDC020917 TaxID=3365102 RepID=UPI00379D650E
MAPEVPETSPAAPGRTLPRAALVQRRVTPGRVFRAAADRVRSTPGTHTWLLVLAVTSAVAAGLSPRLRSYLLHHVSTNLVQLHTHPVRVLFASAFWIETPSALLFYAVLFELVHATAERWLGTARWLLVAAIAHIGATLVSQKAVFFGIRDARLPRSLAHTIDIGVSYGLAGVVGVLAYRVPWPWRWGYLAGVLAFFTYPVLNRGTFTDLGHLTAVLIGLCCYAFTPPGRKAASAPPRSRPRRSTR